MGIIKLGSLLLLATSMLPQRPATDPVAQAEALLQKQQYAEAEEKLHSTLAMQEKNPQAWFDLGFAQSHLGKTTEAVSSYRKATEIVPTWFEAHLNLGLTLAKSGDTAAAIPVLKRATELKPMAGGAQATGKAWLSLAEVQEAGDPKAAAEAFDKAAELLPADPQLSVRAGEALVKANEPAAAEQHFLKAANAGNAQGMAQLVRLMARQKRYQEAEPWLLKYVEKVPNDANARVELARLLSDQGKKAEAIAELEKLNKPGADAAIPMELGEMYLAVKRFPYAERAFRQALPARPQDPEVHLGLGQALLYQQKYGDAETELGRAIQLKPDFADAYDYLADAARQNQHYELSIRVLDARAKYLPDNPKTYFLRAIAYDHMHATKPAIEYYKKFLAVAGDQFPDQQFQARHRLIALQPQ
ncbi:MAG TPA: tetratricopeptide repeat protein [Candidatus Angelobacter sp.]|nr:tetratricopeptide repeat protein [Candidatus Angelobacter sp.]